MAIVLPMVVMVVCVLLKEYSDIGITAELYFLSTAFALCCMSFLHIKTVEKLVFKAALTMSSVFWGSTFLVYTITWVFTKQPHTFILWCFAAGLIVGISCIKWMRMWR